MAGASPGQHLGADQGRGQPPHLRHRRPGHRPARLHWPGGRPGLFALERCAADPARPVRRPLDPRRPGRSRLFGDVCRRTYQGWRADHWRGLGGQTQPHPAALYRALANASWLARCRVDRPWPVDWRGAVLVAQRRTGQAHSLCPGGQRGAARRGAHCARRRTGATGQGGGAHAHRAGRQGLRRALRAHP